jgi:uncharacterized protein (DUF169 family)
MESAIARAINLNSLPVAIMEADYLPDNALQFKEGAFGCVIAFLKSASKGKTAAFSRRTFGCPGGGVGLGFGNCYENFPGGIEHFLSTGNPEFCQTESGKAIASRMPGIREGERYFKTPGIAGKFVESLPMIDTPAEYILFKPIQQLTEHETPNVVVFLVNPDQLSALIVLANYARNTNDNVIVPFAAACHTIGIIPLRESEAETQRAVIGLTDITVRNKSAKDMLSFAVPYRMFLEMESNVPGSFLEKGCWQNLLERNLLEKS